MDEELRVRKWRDGCAIAWQSRSDATGLRQRPLREGGGVIAGAGRSGASATRATELRVLHPGVAVRGRGTAHHSGERDRAASAGYAGAAGDCDGCIRGGAHQENPEAHRVVCGVRHVAGDRDAGSGGGDAGARAREDAGASERRGGDGGDCARDGDSGSARASDGDSESDGGNDGDGDRDGSSGHECKGDCDCNPGCDSERELYGAALRHHRPSARWQTKAAPAPRTKWIARASRRVADPPPPVTPKPAPAPAPAPVAANPAPAPAPAPSSSSGGGSDAGGTRSRDAPFHRRDSRRPDPPRSRRRAEEGSSSQSPVTS